MTVGGDKMPNFYANSSKKEYLSTIQEMKLDANSLKVYGIGIKNNKMSWTENVRYRATIYRWGFQNAHKLQAIW